MGAMAPRLKILMTSGSKKEAQKYCFFSFKSPSKRTPSRFPSGAPMERDTHLQGICVSLKDLIRIPLKKVPRKKHPSMFPESGVPMEMDAHFQALLNISSSPVKEPSIHLSKSPVYEPPPSRRFPGERCPYPETIWTYLPGSLGKELPPRPSPRSLFKERSRIPRVPFNLLPKSLSDEPSSRFPKRGPYGKRCLSPEPFLHIVQGLEQGSPPSRFPSQSSHRERDTTPPEILSAIS